MCGIGLVAGNNAKLRKESVLIIEKHQKNRGPDFSKIQSFKNLSICHQRLSIVGLDKKFNQPYFYKKFILLFNGEIYNFREIAKSYNLSKNSHISDTACLAELISKIGFEKSIKIIDGMYSICLLDKNSQSINICVDDFNIKQLYYAKVLDNIVVASTVNPLIEIIKKYDNQITIDKTTKIWNSSSSNLIPLKAIIFKEFNDAIFLCNFINIGKG